MVLVDPPGEAHDSAPGILIPVGGAQARKGGHHVAAVGIGNFPRQVFTVSGGVDEAQLVPQPLDGRPGYEDGALQGVVHLAVQAPCDGGHQTVLGEHGPFPGVHQQEAPGAIGIFGLARLKAGLAEQGRLLIPGGPGDGDGPAEEAGIGLPVDLAAGDWGGQERGGNVQQIQDLLVPGEGVDVEEHGPGGVGVVGDMDPAAGEFPDEPGLHRAKQELSPLRPLPGVGDVVQDPLELGGGEVGVDHQPRALPEPVREPPLLQFVAEPAGAAALPDDGVVHRLAGNPVPDDGGLPLVSDADSGDVPRFSSHLSHSLHSHPQLGGPDLVGVVLHPAGLGEDLGEFLLGHAADRALPVKQDAAVAGGAGIQGHHVF